MTRARRPIRCFPSCKPRPSHLHVAVLTGGGGGGGKKRVSVTEPHRVPSHVPTNRDPSLPLLLPQHHHHIIIIITTTSISSSICKTRNGASLPGMLTVTSCTPFLQSHKPGAVNPKKEEKEVEEEVCSSAHPRRRLGRRFFARCADLTAGFQSSASVRQVGGSGSPVLRRRQQN